MSVQVAVPLPACRQPLADPPLPEVEPPTTESPTTPEGGPSPRQQPPSPDSEPTAPPPPTLATPAADRTRTSTAGSADPTVVGEVLAGLLAIACGTAAVLLMRRGRLLRQPTHRQVDDFTKPLGRIAARHLPAELVGPTLRDITQAARAAHEYTIDGPITERVTTHVEYPEDLS